MRKKNRPLIIITHCTQGRRVSRRLCQVSKGKGRLTPWTSGQFITEPHQDQQPFKLTFTPTDNLECLNTSRCRKVETLATATPCLFKQYMNSNTPPFKQFKNGYPLLSQWLAQLDCWRCSSLISMLQDVPRMKKPSQWMAQYQTMSIFH